MTVSELPCRFETVNGCAIVTLLPALNNAPWSDIEQTGTHLLEQVRNSPARTVIVDLSPLNYMGSALVALIVRIWKTVKERDGQLIVVNQDSMVSEVLKIAGLNNLWTIVETRDEAFDAAGVSPQAVSRTRETRLLTLVGPLAVIAAGIGLALLILKPEFLPGVVAVAMALGWAALGVVAGAVTFARSSAGGRAAAGLVVAVCLGIAVAAVVFWPDDPAGDAGQAAADPEPVARAPAQNATPVQPTGSDSAVLSPASPAAQTDARPPDPANPQGDPSDPLEPPGGATESAPPDAETAPGN